MAQRRNARRQRGGGYRPPTEWTQLNQTAETAVAGGAKVLVGSFFTDGPTTVRRTRGLISWVSDQVAAIELPMGAFGLCVVSDDAFAAGAASLPGPFTDAGSELWFVHQYVYARNIASTAGIEAWPNQYVIDSSAMRKFTEEERIVVMWESGAAVGSGAFTLFMLRLLTSDSRG